MPPLSQPGIVKKRAIYHGNPPLLRVLARSTVINFAFRYLG